jgi:hypothetical protein
MEDIPPISNPSFVKQQLNKSRLKGLLLFVFLSSDFKNFTSLNNLHILGKNSFGGVILDYGGQ